MQKLKLLKERIKAWNSSYRELKNCRKNTLKTELTNLDSVLDRGEGIDTDVTRRSDVVRILQDIEKTKAMEVAQKAKIKWAVEGDENSKRFEKPNLSGIQFDREFPNKIFVPELAVDLEREWNQSNIDTIVRVLKVFHSASGLRINMKKSKLMGIAVDASRVEQAIRQIGCMALKMPFKYLGSVVGDRMSRVKAWNDVIDTLVTRLSRWKLKTISIGGRLTLLKSVLGSTPIFHMSIYKVPMAVLRTMEGIRARFFNGADNKVRKSSWVSWNQVMASKDAGGLGVASLFALNRGLMFKWVWRFITQQNSLWAKVITAIHGNIGKTVKPTFPSIWLNIIQEVAVMKLKGYASLSDKKTQVVVFRGSGSLVFLFGNPLMLAFLPCDSIFLVEIMSKISRWWDLGYQEINSYEEWTDWMLSIRLPYNLKKGDLFDSDVRDLTWLIPGPFSDPSWPTPIVLGPLVRKPRSLPVGHLVVVNDFGFYAGGDGDGSRINRNLQRGNGGNADGMTPTGFTKYGSGEQVSPSEFSPGLLDLHSFDTDGSGKMMCNLQVHSENNLNLLNQPSYGEGLDEANAYSLNSKFANFSCGEHNAVKSSLADKEKASNVAKIKVVVRKRPLNKKELARKEADIISIDPYSSSLTVHESKVKVDLTEYVEKHGFVFDAVMDEDVTNDEIYSQTVEPIIPIIFQRTKATCFAYGQTGSGKTYTMQPLPLRASKDIFRLMHHHYRNQGYQLHVSFFEIYGGKVFDLLNDRKKLCMREDGKQQVCIVGLQEYNVSNVQTIKELIERGNATRSTGTTGANEESSRSHAILQLAVKRLVDGNESKPPRLVGKLSFIDLAGSERGADTTDNDKQTRMEGAEINKSLLALKECIRALDNDQGHIPFRGSKLTEVLRDSFVGNSRTVMISCISPNSGSCEHTLNTLRYADRVKSLSKGSSSRKDLSSSTLNLRNSIQLPITSSSSSSSILTRSDDVRNERLPYATNRFGWPKQTDRESSVSSTMERVPVARPLPTTYSAPPVENYRSDNGGTDEETMEDDIEYSMEETYEPKDISRIEKPVAQMTPIAEATNDLVLLLEEEDDLVSAHRKQVEETMDIVREVAFNTTTSSSSSRGRGNYNNRDGSSRGRGHGRGRGRRSPYCQLSFQAQCHVYESSPVGTFDSAFPARITRHRSWCFAIGEHVPSEFRAPNDESPFFTCTPITAPSRLPTTKDARERSVESTVVSGIRCSRALMQCDIRPTLRSSWESYRLDQKNDLCSEVREIIAVQSAALVTVIAVSAL
ncbi:kinesin-like protein KIN-13B [Tanacetum coccineum]